MLDEEKEDEKIDKMLKRLRRYENKIDINNSRKIHATKRKYLLKNLDTTEIKGLMSKEKVLNIILDNYSTHKAVLVKKVAEILNINLIYLPEYSPDLNPIEDVWRVIKDYISRKYLKDVEHLKKLFKEEFYKIIRNPSFYTTWVQKFITAYTQ
ncbi:MAG: transposase [Euryarchaeota archaeon]|nr:transposase [Euryarchaeota archaeon]MBV1767246.1 transposase [Methanobacterium sp.]